jgi:putative spermidine/putrescine transport system permease protein
MVVVPLSLTGQSDFAFPPTSWSLHWFNNFFTNPAWRDSLFNSLRVAAGVVGLSCVVGTACALGIDRGRFPGKTLLRALVLSPMIVPLIITAVGIYTVFLGWHLVGDTLGFVLAHTAIATPLVVVMVSTSLARFDRRLELAAASLGASPLATFCTVTVRLIMPGIIGGAIFAFITSFDEVVIALFLSTPFMQTLPVQMYSSLETTTDPTFAAASAVLLVAYSLLILVAMAFVRNLREPV